MFLKIGDQKFSADLVQCWGDYIGEYKQVAEDYNLNET